MKRWIYTRTGAIYDSLKEAQDKLGFLGYIDAVESGELKEATVIK